MSFRPHLEIVEISLRVPRGNEAFWAVICELDSAGPWTVADVVARSNVHTRTVSQYIERLRRGGFAQVVEERAPRHGAFPAKVYRLTKSPADAPRLMRDGRELPETANQVMWRAMKMLKVFGPSELAEYCPGVSLSTARGYVVLLAKAGVLVLARKRKPDAEGRYRVAQNLGSRAPRILQAKIVFDPNTNRVIGAAEAREVQP